MRIIAARKAREIMENVRRVLAMEIMGTCQAIDLRGNKGLGTGTKPTYELVRQNIEKLVDDRPLI